MADTRSKTFTPYAAEAGEEYMNKKQQDHCQSRI